MSAASVFILALGMSVDALVAALSRGSGSRRPSVRESIRVGLLFGAVEAITPVVGWAAGVAASSFITAVDHWIAFGLLCAVGARMLYEAVTSRDAEPAPRAAPSFAVTLVTAVGTSLDAMAVGVSLAFLEVNILVVALAIGATTAVMAGGGMLVGRLVGRRFGRIAEFVGGLALICLGSMILFEHLNT